MRALVAFLAFGLAVGGAVVALSLTHGGSLRSQPTTPVRASAENAAYCVEDNEHGHWFHFEAEMKTSAIRSGPCPFHDLYRATP